MAEIRADEISRILREQIKGYGKQVEVPKGLMGLVLNLEEAFVLVAVMGEQVELREGDTVKRTGRIADVPVGPAMSGRVVDALGNPVDNKGWVVSSKLQKNEMKGRSSFNRASMKEPMQTGIKT